MNRWQHFYDLAAAQLAVAYAQTRNFDAAEKEAAARRMALDAKAFADAFKSVEEAAFEPKESGPPDAITKAPGGLNLDPLGEWLGPESPHGYDPKLAGVIPTNSDPALTAEPTPIGHHPPGLI
jgi:hypothetical protein